MKTKELQKLAEAIIRAAKESNRELVRKIAEIALNHSEEAD